MKVSALSEEITVTGEAPVVDTQTNQVSTNYDKDWVRNAPDPALLVLRPHQRRARRQPSAHPATRARPRSARAPPTTPTSSTAPTSPRPSPAPPGRVPNTDAIEEIEVLSLGATGRVRQPAGRGLQRGHPPGPNAFHGDANYYFQSQGLTEQQHHRRAGRRRCPTTATSTTTPPASSAGRSSRTSCGSSAPTSTSANFSRPRACPRSSPTKREADRVFGKLNWQINAKNKLMFAYHDDYYELPGDVDAATAPSAVTVETATTRRPTSPARRCCSDKTYFEARYSGFYGKDHGDPLVDGEPRVKPRFLDLDTRRDHGRHLLLVRRQERQDRVQRRRSRTSPTTSWAAATTSSSASSTTAAAATTSSGHNDYIYTYGGVPAYGYTQLPYHQGGQHARARASSSTTPSASARG